MSSDPNHPDFDPWKAEAQKEKAAKAEDASDLRSSLPSTKGLKRQPSESKVEFNASDSDEEESAKMMQQPQMPEFGKASGSQNQVQEPVEKKSTGPLCKALIHKVNKELEKEELQQEEEVKDKPIISELIAEEKPTIREVKKGLGLLSMKEESNSLIAEEYKEMPNDLLLGDEEGDPTDLLKAAFEVGDKVNALKLLQQNVFKSSKFPISPPVKAYLEEMLEEGFNRYCIDCKENEVTHCMISYGTFVCETCAKTHHQLFSMNNPGAISVYPKPIFTDHWDNYQLSSIVEGFGGNEPMFQFLKEYELDEITDIKKRYESRALRWYKQRHLAYMDGFAFNETRPIKDFKEVAQKAKGAMNSASTTVKEAKIGSKFKSMWGKLTGKKD